MIDFEKIINENYDVISINYEKENGVNIYKNLDELKNNFDNLFYKLYIFNENRMYEFINDNGEILCHHISKDMAKEILYKRSFYFENDKRKINITYFIDENNERISYFSGIEG